MPSINDIVLKWRKKGQLFNTYRPIEEVAKNVFKSFVKYYVPGNGFPISNYDPRCGVLSNIMAVSTFLELESKGVDIAEFRDAFRLTLQSVFDSVYKNGYRSEPVFDASPYLTEDLANGFDSYVETAAKILITMIDLRDSSSKNDVEGREFVESFTLAGQKVSSYLDLTLMAEKLLIDAIKFLNDAVLNVDEKEYRIREIENNVVIRDGLPSEIKYRGWTFCHPNGEDDEYSLSLYYTYHVTHAYISLYNAYPKILEKLFEENKDFSNDDSDTQDYSEKKKILYKRSKEFILNNKTVIDEFRIRVASAGRYIESVLQENDVNISTDYVKSDLTGITFSDIVDTKESQNAVINTLFVAAIFLNADLDSDYEYVESKDVVNKNRAWFLDQEQYAIMNVKKIYKILKASRREELVDSYNLYAALFSEEFPSHQNDLVKKLRKGCRTVAFCDLVPVLCNTYMNIFRYMIRYPQLEMFDNLNLIMENCANNEDWIWGDNDGFDINNNLYYLIALENFYEYYRDYEHRLSGNEERYKKEVQDKEEEFKQRLNEQKEINEELEKENQLLKEKRSDLDIEVEKLAEKKFDSVFEQRLIDCLAQMLTETTLFYIDAFSESKTAAQAVEMFKNDKRLRVALALYSSIDFEKVALGKGSDFAGLKKYNSDGVLTKDYAELINKQINDSLADNVREKE